MFTYISQVMGSKNIFKQLNIPLTTVRAIIKKFQTSGIILPGRGHKCMLSPRRVRKMAREAKMKPKDHSSRTADFS